MSVFSDLADKWLAFRWAASPVEATFMGIHDYDDTLGDYGPDHLEQRRSEEASFLARFSDLPLHDLTPQERTDLRLAISTLECNQRMEQQASEWKRDPTVYPEICLTGLFLPLVREYAPFEERARAVLARLREVPKVLDQARASLSSPVVLFAEIALEVVAGGKLFLQILLPQIGDRIPGLRSELEGEVRRGTEAFEDYEEYLKTHAIPSGADQFALGQELFDYLLRTSHMLPYDSKDLIAFGEEVVSDTVAEMELLARRHGRADGWMGWVEEAKADHPEAADLKNAYERAMEQARDFVIDKELVTVPSNESLSVIWTPEFERSQIPYAAYMPPAPLEAEQRGLFYVTPVEEQLPPEEQERRLRGSSYAGIPVTALHEGYPGHHLQLCVANRHPSLVRRSNWSTLFGEGWALYCEDLMYEKGFFPGPASRLMQLKDLLWRGVRVLLDVQMHTGQVSLDGAVEALVETAKLEEPNARSEAKRYARTPTQPMSYAVGKKLIQDILARYRRSTGPAFSLSQFHDRLLACGNIPPRLAEQELLEEEAS
jgi:uncharacterized protein (DUF885 family)